MCYKMQVLNGKFLGDLDWCGYNKNLDWEISNWCNDWSNRKAAQWIHSEFTVLSLRPGDRAPWEGKQHADTPYGRGKMGLCELSAPDEHRSS